jgi:hypothetical protein
MKPESIVDSIRKLPAAWNPSGSLNIQVIERLYRCAEGAEQTSETGCGKSTLALSHAAKRHLVFACEAFPGDDPEEHSLNKVRKSELLRAGSCEFVIGTTQTTLPVFGFDRQFDLVLLDGPHGFPFPELEYFYFYPHIRGGGWLVIDDIQIPSVALMMDVLRRDQMFSLEFVIRTTAFFRRTDSPTFPQTLDGWWEQGYNRRYGYSVRHVDWKSRPRVFAQGLLRRLSALRGTN